MLVAIKFFVYFAEIFYVAFAFYCGYTIKTKSDLSVYLSIFVPLIFIWTLLVYLVTNLAV